MLNHWCSPENYIVDLFCNFVVCLCFPAMDDVGEIVLVVAGSLGGLVLLIMAAFLCACCWKRKYKNSEDKGQLYSPVDEGYHNQNRLSVDSGSSTASRSRGQSPAITRKTIRYMFPSDSLWPSTFSS